MYPSTAKALSLGSALIAVARAQQVCTSTTETHPSLTWSKCTSSGCSDVDGSVVVDANWRWTHTVSGSTNCYTGNEWDTSLCPDGETCAEACCVDGADYSSTYGVTTSGNALTLKFVTEGAYSTNIGSRLYLMEDESTYQMFTLLGNEFTFDVDVSAISCGLNGALYFVSMDEDGGMAKYDGNKAGAKYGTGYCDAQCARDVKFINGVANVEDWTPSSNDANSGVGNLGTCCPEMDIWEANDISTAFTAHPCTTLTQHSCEGDNCGGTYSTSRYAGTCDPDGCDFNSYRQGNESFYGPGSDFTVDTTQKVTVVTQFITDSSGALSSIKRFYVQNSKVISNSETTITGTSGNSLNEEFCSAQKTAFGDEDDFTTKGGWSGMDDALAAPMVLVMSLWDDHYANMLWLDSTYPVDSTAAGSTRGTCSTDSGVPATVESETPNASVVFSNIKFGPIGSTFDSTGTDDSSSSASSSAAAATKTTAKATSAAAATSAKASSTSAAAVKSSSTSVAAVAQSSSVASVKTTSIVPVAETTSAAAVASSAVQSAVEDSSSSAVAVQPTTSAAAVVTSAAAAQSTTVVSEASPTSSDDDEDCEDDDTATATPVASSSPTTSGSSSVSAVALYYQCGGTNWTGSTECASGLTCKAWNDYYHQCVEA